MKKILNVLSAIWIIEKQKLINRGRHIQRPTVLSSLSTPSKVLTTDALELTPILQSLRTETAFATKSILAWK
jgi:hypothetical protein